MAIAILDIDGTLVDTNYHHTIAWFRAFVRHDIALPNWRIHRHIGMGGDQVVTSLCVFASSAKEDEVNHYLDLLDARDLADAWTTSADVESTKPQPDLVESAITKIGGQSDGERPR